ncbi:MAG: hypothetical protein ACF8AM_23685 [Rhodopirellula sp. JB055]|uniref:hypothetical protein n=1 Tax=Rhodopirellula sp. JB055 TaxID=3342846 RepID=UPI00370A8529
MSSTIEDLMDGYFDESLSQEQFQQLKQWIKSDPLHAQRFASAMLLHDRLRNEFTTNELLDRPSTVELSTVNDPALVRANGRPDEVTLAGSIGNTWTRSVIAMATTACLVLISLALLWNGFGSTSASAAMLELNRIIAANRQLLDRTFLISVEESAAQEDLRRDSPEHRRPPKPSLDNAILDVRGSDQFVLKREVEPGVFFVTGSNGTTSWAVRPDGPVRMSDDLTRFSRDLPGHERSLPINNIEDGLGALQTAYNLELLSVEQIEGEVQGRDVESDAEASWQMVATKKPGFRGPGRVEILYTASSGLIREMRFVDMPYGRNVVTLKMTLMEKQAFAADHFDHESYHDPKRIVEFE